MRMPNVAVPRHLAIAVATIVALLAPATPIRAQDAYGQIRITVRSDAPIPGTARATLLAPAGVTITVPITANGTALFEDVTPGIYEVRVTIGGRTYVSADFDAIAGRVSAVAIDARPASLRVIGTVRAETPITVTFESVADDAPIRTTAGSLADALGSLAGASVVGGNGRDGVFSLRDFDANQVGASINGIRAGGNAGATAAAFGDLFSGASASFSPTQNTLGGSLSFTTLQPTKAGNANAELAIGDEGKSFVSASASGSAGRLGFAAEYADRTSATQLDGRRYEDLSGVDYAHAFGRHSIGELVKLREALDDAVTLEASGLLSNIDYGTGCAEFVSELPCGIGPQARIDSRFAFASILARAEMRGTNITADAAVNESHNFVDETARTLLATPMPYARTTPFLNREIDLAIAHPIGLHTPSVRLSVNDAHDTTTQSAGTAPLSATANTSTLNVVADDTYKPNAHLSLALDESFNRSTFVSAGATTQFTADYRFDAKRSASASALVGTTSSTPTGAYTYTDPASATFDCTDGVVRIGGPPDPEARQTTRTLSASYRQSVGLGRISVNAYRTDADGAPAYAILPLAAAQAPPGYFDALASLWNRAGICGGYAFPATRVYSSQYVAGLRQRNAGATIGATLPLGRAVIVLANATRSVSEFLSLDPRFASPFAFYRIGAPLPQSGRYAGGITLDAALSRTVEVLAHAQYTDGENPANLPAHTILALGGRVRAGRGAFTVLIANLLDTDAFPYASARGFAPLALNGGGSVAFAAMPLPPRQFQVDYQIKGVPFGPHSTPPQTP